MEPKCINPQKELVVLQEEVNAANSLQEAHVTELEGSL